MLTASSPSERLGDQVLPTASNIGRHTLQIMDFRDMFSEEFVQQSPLGEFFLPADQSRPSSSSSSLRSMSVGSPENSSLIVAGKASSSPGDQLAPTARPQQPIVVAAAPVPLPPHQPVTTTQAAHGRSIQFPTLAVADEAAITSAMLSIISSSSPLPAHPQTSTSAAPAGIRGYHRGGAFKPYNCRRRTPITGLRVERQQGYRGQVMFKRAVSMLKQISSMNAYARPIQESLRPSSNQLHHMISERKRREKLNESFTALRMLLPPGTKKDKASVLAATKEYLNRLKSQISELEEKNRIVADEAGGEDLGGGQDGLRVEISRAAESSSEMERVKLVVTVRTECDTADLVLRVLECLKEMGNISLVSLEANGCSRQNNPVRRATFALQVKSQRPVEWDEGAFREAIIRTIRGAEAAAPSASS